MQSIISLTKEPIQIQSDTSFPLALQMKVLLVENLEALAFIVLPQSIKYGIL
jgi:hypothetical protein